MPLDFEADLAIFMNPDEFGTAVTIDPDGTPRGINAIFETPSEQVDGQGGADIASTRPYLMAPTSDVAGVVQNSKLRVEPNPRLGIEGGNYRVGKPPRPDATGLTKLELHKI